MSSTSPSLRATSPTIPLEGQTRTAVADLQAALSEVVSALPGFTPSARAVDIQRLLGLDKKLGWQLHKFLSAPNPLAELASVPGEPSMRRILAAAARRHVPREVTARAATALEQFESFVSEHAKDRFELISLTNGLAVSGGAGGAGAAGGADQQHDLRVRKAAFKSLSHLWGIKAEVCIRTIAFGVGTPGRAEMLGIRGDVGLQRLRHGVPMTVAVQAEDDSESARTLSKPGHSDLTTRGLQILEEFSTTPLPRMEPRPQRDGSIETDVVFPPSGRSGAVTFYAAQHVAATPRGEQARYAQGAAVRIPCERIVCELLVPEGWTDPAKVSVAVFGRRDGVDRGIECRPVDLLPQQETATYLGVMKSAPLIPGVPHHPQAVQRALERVGMHGTRFDVYRCEVQYPLLHTVISLDVEAITRAT